MSDLLSHSFAPWQFWIGFLVFVFLMIALDIVVLGGNKAQRISIKEAFNWSLIWISLALLFNLLLWLYVRQAFDLPLANKLATEFFTGYLIEKSLSVDNLFVFLMIFQYFKIPPEYQRRVLTYGVLGAVFLRFVMILGGLWLVTRFHWILYIFGFFLVLTGFKMLFFAEKEADLSNNLLISWMSRHLNMTPQLAGHAFMVTIKGVRYFTPLFLALVLIEISDVIFALDSIPAIFAVTEDPFIVATSNIFAILGLRALYFLLADMADRFHLLKYGIALILMFIGGKMLLAYWFKVPVGPMLIVIATLLAASIFLSLRYKPR